MFIVEITWDWDEIPNGRISYQETFSAALGAVERIRQEFPESRATAIDIFEASSERSKDKRLVASLRTYP